MSQNKSLEFFLLRPKKLNSFLFDDMKRVLSLVVKNVSAIKRKQGPLRIISSKVNQS